MFTLAVDEQPLASVMVTDALPTHKPAVVAAVGVVAHVDVAVVVVVPAVADTFDCQP